jgi:hypothetical protein
MKLYFSEEKEMCVSLFWFYPSPLFILLLRIMNADTDQTLYFTSPQIDQSLKQSLSSTLPIYPSFFLTTVAQITTSLLFQNHREVLKMNMRGGAN